MKRTIAVVKTTSPSCSRVSTAMISKSPLLTGSRSNSHHSKKTKHSTTATRPTPNHTKDS